MKKSNRVFIALIATLYIVPALTFGAAQFRRKNALQVSRKSFRLSR